MDKGKIVLGTLVGISAGVIAGILFAPDKGSATRKKIKERGDKYFDNLKAKFDVLANRVSDNLENTKDKVENLAEKGKEKFDDVKNDLKDAAVNIKKDLSIEKIEERPKSFNRY